MMTYSRATGVAFVFLLTACQRADIEMALDDIVSDKTGCDAGVAAVGDQCSAGEGDCQQYGSYRCADGGLVCVVEPRPARAELCETGEDEDCDGETDEAPDGRCCDDDDCPGGVCVFRQADRRIEGGTCTGGASCEDDRDCPTGDCVDQVCVFVPPVRAPGIGQTVGGGFTQGGGYALQVVHIGSPGPMGTMTDDDGHVLRLGPLRAP